MGAATTAALFALMLMVGADDPAVGAAAMRPNLRFQDVTQDVGLGVEVLGPAVARACFADLTSDGRPDIVVDRHRIFLNRRTDDSVIGVTFEEVLREQVGLPEPTGPSVVVFADLDNDGHLDAVVGEYVDALNPDWNDHGRRTGWHRGTGNGTFEPQRRLFPVEPKTTAAMAIGDVDRDGRLDVYLGNWYRHYGESLDGHHNDLLLQPLAGEFALARQGTTGHLFHDDDEQDRGGRPTYGAMIADITENPMWDAPLPEIIELNYGRRWNRVYMWDPMILSVQPPDLKPGLRHSLWRDIAPDVSLDGDGLRHGQYPKWLKEVAKRDPRFERPDEKPFRSNGNTFDCAIGDVDNDGWFDIFISEITHGWAGDSSDRTRLLFNHYLGNGQHRFAEERRYNVDRIPPTPDDDNEPHHWNQGDLFCELADLDHDGRLDLILSSGDYPDDQRLRLYIHHEQVGVRDATSELGLDHDGSQQISLADFDGDGAIDILAGQTFNRFTPEQREGRTPQLRLFRNHVATLQPSLTLRLEGNGTTTNRDALGALVKIRIGKRTMQRQLIGIGGHAGKQHDFQVHFGLGGASVVDELVVIWPDANGTAQTFQSVAAGHYRLKQAGSLLVEGQQ